MVLSKRGVAPLVFVLVAMALVVSTGLYFIASDSSSTNELTAAVTGLPSGGPGDDGLLEIETITSCNITLNENVNNIGHDYQCTGANGFFIGKDDLTIDCQNHSITCVGACDEMAGFVLNGKDNTEIRNCRIYNFEDGFKLTNNASNNLLSANTLQNNSDGVDLNDAPSNNITLSYFYNNTACGVNVSKLTHSVDTKSMYNDIWNNKFYSNGTVSTGSPEACNDLTSYTYWYLNKSCLGTNTTNIIGGPCLGGNYWSTYTGKDVTGDGLGDSNIPYQDGNILATAVGDLYPLVDPCEIPGVISEDTTCPATELVSDSGEGIAIVDSNTLFECNGTILNANRSGEGGPWTWADDMRGIEIVGVNNVTIRGCQIHDFRYGIYISNAYNIVLENNQIHNNNDTGIYVTSLSYNISIINNTVDNTYDNGTNQSYGIKFIGSYPSTGSRVSAIKNNTIANATKIGVYLYSNSNYISIWDNLIAGNTNGTVVEDSGTTDLRRNRFEDNDNVGLYFEDASTIAEFGFYEVSGNNFTRNLVGLDILDSTSSDEISGTFINNTLKGIYLRESPINIGQVNVSGSSVGAHIVDTSGLTLGSLTLFNNTDGLKLDSITNVQIGESVGVMDIYDNDKGIHFFGSNDSFLSYEEYSSEHSFIWNNTANLFFVGSNNNTITGFTITNASVAGINLTGGSTNNLFYNNNISDNTVNAQDTLSNFWNTSKSSGTNIIGGSNLGGNYWGDYLGADTTGDGIGDNATPHTSNSGITGGNGDFFPLLGTGNASCSTLTHNTFLSGNVSIGSGNCFTIGAHNVELDCQGYTITGNNGSTPNGIFMRGYDNATIKNCVLDNFTTAINLGIADNVLVYNNTIIKSVTWGINLNNLNNSNISNNDLGNSNSTFSIKAIRVAESDISENTISNDHGTGIHVQYSNTTNFTNNLLNDSVVYSFLLEDSNNNTFTNNRIENSTFAWSLEDSNYNLIYNNYINATTLVFDNNTNFWNTTYSCEGTNILGGDCIGGNYWADFINGSDVYNGSDDGSGSYPYNTSNDGIGDNEVPFNYSNQINVGEDLSIAAGDFLPLVIVPAACGTITSSITLTQSLTTTGDCFIIAADDITIDLAGFTLTGNGSGIGINISDRSGVNIIGSSLGSSITNFTYGVYVDPSSEINLSNLDITNATYAVYLDYTNNSSVEYINVSESTYAITLNNSLNNTIQTNNITNNDYGILIESSTNNNIYNNVFDNTQNAIDDTSFNNWNTSYLNGTTNIVGGTTTGGNYWSDYTGVDNGLGVYPYNTSGDGIGDTQLPYNQNITGGDYLPLISTTGVVGYCQEVTADTILNSNITCVSGDGVTILGDDITLDCQGFSIIGDGTDAGILVENRDGVTIKNCDVSNFYYGVKVVSSINTNISSGNNITSNAFYGIYLYGSNDTTIDSNDITNDNNGVYSISSYNSKLTNNTINLNKKFYGYYGYNSGNTTIYGNTMFNNYHGIYFVGSDEGNISDNDVSITDVYSIFLHSGSDSSIIRDNTLMTGKYAAYLKSNSSSNSFINNSIRDHTSSGIYVKDSEGNLIESNTIANNSRNVVIYSSPSTLSSHNLISNASSAVEINHSSSAIFTNNTLNATTIPVFSAENATTITLYNNSFNGSAYINGSDSAYLEENNMTLEGDNDNLEFNITNSNSVTLSNNNLEFVYVQSATSPTLQDNTLLRLTATRIASAQITSNTLQNNANVSIQLSDVNSSTIQDNTVKNTSGGISLVDSYSNNFYDNWLQTNSFGMNVSNSTSNIIYNNYFENTVNIYEDTANTWYSSYACGTPNIVGGPCKGGNFYSDYYGLDDGSNGRDEGDGVGDNPASYTVSSYSSDSYPLVLYVARQYFSPSDNATLALTATANFSGALSDEQVLPNTVQSINYSYNGSDYAELTGLLNQSNVDASTLIVHYEEFNKTFVNTSGTTGFADDFAMYIYHNNQFDAGIYLCPEVSDINSTNSTCDNRINVTTFPSTTPEGHSVTAVDTYYKVENITNTAIGIVIESTDICGANIYHDVTSTQDTSCSGTAFNVLGSNLTIDCAGYTTSGDGSGLGFNVTGVDGITIQHCVISDFNNSILVENSSDITLYNITILNATTWGALLNNNVNVNITNFTSTETGTFGVYLDNTNDSSFTELQINVSTNGFRLENSHNNTVTNSLITNNTNGINSTDSNNNLIFNNYFNNTLNAYDNGTNIYNTSLQNGTNIIGGTLIAGNYWNDYSGWDTDLDGIGETELDYNSSNNIINGGDFYPLTEVGKIACGTVTTDITMSQNVTFNSTCFNITASDLTFDCNGYGISRSADGAAFGIVSEDQNNVTIQHCTILNATRGILLLNHNNSFIFNNTLKDTSITGILLEDSVNINVSSNLVSSSGTSNIFSTNTTGSTIERNTVNDSTYGLRITLSNYNNFSSNWIVNNTMGANITFSGNNTIYNNYFNNIQNANEAIWTNFYNTTYFCSDNFTNIVGGNCSAGNFWSDYLGSDGGNGTGVFNMNPWNISGDFVGDDLIPYNTSNLTDGLGDYLPLIFVSSSSSSGGGSPAGSPASPSPSSGGGGGGGGGGGSSSSTTTDADDETCSESWTCTSWSDCAEGSQTRTCSDNNDCGTTEDQPDESQSCTEDDTSSTTDDTTADDSADTETTPLIEYITEASPARTLTLSGLALLAVFGTVYAYWGFMHPAARLRRRLRGTNRVLGDASTDNLKGQYAGIYKLYLKLSERNKQNFYANVSQIREHIEEQLKSQKEIEMLFDKAQFGDLQSRKHIYMQIYEEYQNLPAKTQEDVYPKLVDLREKLERGVE